MKTTLLFCTLIVSFTSVSTEAQDAKWLEFPAGQSYPLTEKDDELSVRIPANVLADAPDLAKLETKCRDVSTASGRARTVANSFVLVWGHGADEVGPSLVVTAKAAELLPDTYTVVVDFVLPDATAAKPKRQSVTFTLQRHAPQLASLRSVSAWQVQQWFLLEPTVTGGRLTLVEESRKSAVRDISFTEVRTAPASAAPETGKLMVNLSTPVVEAGQEVQVEVLPDGNFPIGKTTGKLRVNSPQLAAPLIVDYEVTTKRSIVLIGVFALIGSGIGWLTRIYLHLRKNRVDAQIAASLALSDLRQASASVPDAKFAATIHLVEESLKNAAAESSPADIMTAVNLARTALANATTDLDARRTALTGVLLPLHRLLHRAWNLPPSVAVGLASARTATKGLVAIANSQNIQLAAVQMEEQMPAARNALVKAANQWREDALDYLQAIGDYPPPLQDKDVERLKEAIAAWQEQFGTPIDHVGVDDSGLELELTNTNAAYAQAKRIAKDLQAGGVSVALLLRSRLDPAASNELFGEVISTAKKQGEATMQEVVHPDRHRSEPAARQVAARLAWSNALLSMIPEGADSAPITTALEQGQWNAAAEAAKAIVDKSAAGRKIKSATGGEAGIKSLVAIPEIGSAPQARRFMSHFTLAPESGQTDDSLRTVRELAGTRSERMELRQEGKWIALAQSAILCLVFIALAFGFYGAEWIGTCREMLAVFAWAFGLDLTADSLTPLLKKFGTPAAAT